ncbi:MAG: type IV toxin-antitoxin system AbiEi family antitoxin domain-containing protein [Marmoricola sp.]
MNLVPAPGRTDVRTTDGLLGEPFTPAMAARHGLGRAGLERLLREGRVVRLVRGVYLDARVPTTALLRARSLALVVGHRQVVVETTAAWVHGAAPLRLRPDAPIPLDVQGRRARPQPRIPLLPAEVTVLGGVRCTAPVRTALDVARHLAPERALPMLDAMIRAGALTHTELIAASAARPAYAGTAQVRELTAMADGRAADVAESVLRLRWYEARLPTPAPGLLVVGQRLALALPLHRFGVVLGRVSDDILTRTAAAGWRVVVLDAQRVRVSDPAVLIGHLEREFHQHLLSAAG